MEKVQRLIENLFHKKIYLAVVKALLKTSKNPKESKFQQKFANIFCV